MVKKIEKKRLKALKKGKIMKEPVTFDYMKMFNVWTMHFATDK